MTFNGETICVLCGSKEMYCKLENYSSVTKCAKCGNVFLNGFGLPCSNLYYKDPDPVFDTIERANVALLRVLQKRLSNDELEQVMMEWHNELHSEVIE